MIPAFPKIFTLGDRNTKNIFESEVEITEKIDGSAIAFGKIKGELFIRSKGSQLFVEHPEQMFKAGIEYIKSIEDRLLDGFIYYGEYLKSNKHNVLVYDRIPKNHIMLYAVYFLNYGSYNRYEWIKFHADKLDLEAVPLLYKGKVNTIEDLKSNLDRISVLGKAKIEGFVVKNYDQQLMVGGQVLPLVMGKYVSEQFKEIHQKEWKKENTGRGRWDVYKSQFATEARWRKAIQHLIEKNDYTRSPKDIGNLLREINQDIEAEEKENIKEWLWNEFGKELLREAGNGFPQWYKNYLLESSIEEE